MTTAKGMRNSVPDTKTMEHSCPFSATASSTITCLRRTASKEHADKTTRQERKY